MTLTEEMTKLISTMESDFEKLKEAQNRKYLEPYERGYVDGAVETFEPTLQLVKMIESKINEEKT